MKLIIRSNMCGYVCVHAHVSVISINSVVLFLGAHTVFTQQSVVLFCFLNTQNHHGMIQCSGSVHVQPNYSLNMRLPLQPRKRYGWKKEKQYTSLKMGAGQPGLRPAKPSCLLCRSQSASTHTAREPDLQGNDMEPRPQHHSEDCPQDSHFLSPRLHMPEKQCLPSLPSVILTVLTPTGEPFQCNNIQIMPYARQLSY